MQKILSLILISFFIVAPTNAHEEETTQPSGFACTLEYKWGNLKELGTCQKGDLIHIELRDRRDVDLLSLVCDLDTIQTIYAGQAGGPKSNHVLCLSTGRITQPRSK
jgi:hypothetical protein